jgi:RNA polymerase-binding transcription factor DksA
MKKTQKKKKPAPKPKRAAAVKKPAVKKASVRKAVKKTHPRASSKPAVKKADRLKAVRLKAGKKGKTSHKPSGRSLKKKVLCEFCGEEIPPERIEILPDTTTCVQCSQTKPYSEAQIIGLNGEDAENRLNVEDFEEADTDFSISYNDQW